jgi:hypothetical protein
MVSHGDPTVRTRAVHSNHSIETIASRSGIIFEAIILRLSHGAKRWLPHDVASSIFNLGVALKLTMDEVIHSYR